METLQLYLPLAVRGRGTGLDTVLLPPISISTSLAELGGRDVKGLSGRGAEEAAAGTGLGLDSSD